MICFTCLTQEIIKILEIILKQKILKKAFYKSFDRKDILVANKIAR